MQKQKHGKNAESYINPDCLKDPLSPQMNRLDVRISQPPFTPSDPLRGHYTTITPIFEIRPLRSQEAF